jgi:hypothetical protein
MFRTSQCLNALDVECPDGICRLKILNQGTAGMGEMIFQALKFAEIEAEHIMLQ